MVIGITMIKAVPGREKTAYHALKKIEGIKEIHHLFGEFDFFVIIKAESKGMLNHLIEIIRDLEEVVETWPLLIARDESLSEVEVTSSQMGTAMG